MAGEGEHRHGWFGKAHAYEAAEHDAHARSHDGGHHHQHRVGEAHGQVTWRGLLTLAVAGGLLPCPSAIVVMLAAISLGQVLFGMLLIVAFSLGLAGVLTGIGIALVFGKRLRGRFGVARLSGSPVAARALAALPIASAFAVMLAGTLITYQAWQQPGL